jgi:RecB family exonuclease
VWSPSGTPALLALRAQIDAGKGADPLQPVTVIVPSGPIGLSVRRTLAQGVGADGRPGIANVTFITLDALADTVAGDRLMAEGCRPLTDAVLRAGIRMVLNSRPWPALGTAGDHPSTIDAIVTTYRELRSVDVGAIDALARASRRSDEMVRLLRAVRTQTAQWFDAVDTMEAATALLDTGSINLARRVGSVIVYLPTSAGPHAQRFLHALARLVVCTVLIGATGDPEADAAGHQLVDQLQPTEVIPLCSAPALASAQAVVSAPTADAELLLVLRDVMTRCAAGTPLERMAIVHAGSAPYATLVPSLLRQAGIPCNGGAMRPLATTVAGRVLLGALSLPEHDWRREDVVQWLTTGPLRNQGRPVPAARWDVLSAQAGVTAGLTEWRRCLGALEMSLRAEADRGNPEREDEETWQRIRTDEAAQCASLAAFIDRFATQLSLSPTQWADWAEWATRLLRSLVGGSAAIEEWPSEERAAAEAVQAAVAQLAVLDDLGLPWSAAAAMSALEAELAVPAPQTTRFGAGVWVASIAAAAGHTFDALYVVGLNDGAFPPRPPDDVLLPDRERKLAATRGPLPLRGGRAAAMRRDYLAALAGAAFVHLSYRRGSVRDGRELRPSRWALDSIGTLTGQNDRLYQSQLEAVVPTAGYRVEPSFMAAVRSGGAPLDLADRDLRSLVRWNAAGGRVAEHPLGQPGTALGRSLDMVTGRRRGFTRYEGNVRPLVSPQGLVPSVLSPSGLERFAECPRRYFFESVLRVAPRPITERLLSADSGALGSLVHRILEQYVRPQIGRLPGIGPDDPFAVERMQSIAEMEMAAFEMEGLAGPGATWLVERTRLMRALRRFAVTDRQWREMEGIVTTGVEQQFGHDGLRPVAIDVPGRQPVAFRGTIDRVDRRPDGSAIVTDYKTGRAGRFRRVEDDHFGGGRTVQLPIYAAAVGAAAERPVESAYWCVSESEGFERFGFTVDAEEVDALGQVIGVLTTSMASGQFPANPGEDERTGSCTFCPFSSVCPQDRFRTWQRVRQDPDLSGYTDLVA